MTHFFDPRSVERETSNVSVVENGQYLAVIQKAKKKESHSGLQLFVFFEIVAPDRHKGKVVMQNFNLENNSEAAARIGKQQFVKLLDCIGWGEKVLPTENVIEGETVKLDIVVEPKWNNPTESQNAVKRYLQISPTELQLIKPRTQDLDVPF